jgi:hypothetical protein
MFWQDVETQAQAQEPSKELRDLVPDLPAAQVPLARFAKFTERPMQAGLLFSPGAVELDGDRLIWNPQNGRYKRTRSTMLDNFIGLCDADDFPAAVLAFAKKWGVLGVCEHGLPCSHNQSFSGPPCLPMLVTPLPRGATHSFDTRTFTWRAIENSRMPEVRFCEPIGAWWAWSRKMKALLAIAAEVNQGKRARVEDWNTLKDICPTGLEEPYVKDLQVARRELAWELDGWISIGQVRPRISWNRTPSGWRFNLDAVSIGPNLFGLLALYIASEVSGTGKGIVICSSCARSYRPERRLNPNHRNYCPDCRGDSGKQAARRDAARDYRRRQRERVR